MQMSGSGTMTGLDPRPASWAAANRTALWAIAAAAIVARVLFIGLACRLHHQSLQDWAGMGDGVNYIHYADHMFGRPTAFSAYDARVFPGLPIAMGLVSLCGMPAWFAGIVVGVISGAGAAALTAILCRCRRVGWMLAVLPPIFLVCSVGPTTEPLLLLLCLLGLLIGEESGWVGTLIAGLLFGYAGIVRPVACFAVMAFIAREWMSGRRSRPIVAGAIAAAVVLSGLAIVRHVTGDALYGVRYYAESDSAYRGDLFTWPFKSLIFTPFYEPVGRSKLIYVWLHVAAVLGLIGVLARRVRSQPRTPAEHRMDVAMLVWLAGNTLFVLCVGNKWGLQAFPRFALPALPAMAWAVRRWIPASVGWLALAAVISFAVALRHAS
ncbi:MAG: hypothetical protein ACTHLZ_16340 [Tepidisphaeraceae bacterium]